MLWRLISQVLFLDDHLSVDKFAPIKKANFHLSNALGLRNVTRFLESSRKHLLASHSEVAAGRIAPFHSFSLTFRVKDST